MKKCFSSSIRFSQEILLIMLLIIGFASASFAQLTGVKTIPGTYATLAAAIADLNSQGVGSGGVTFNINAGYTETFSSSTDGLITATGTSSNPIVFQKSGGGANPIITAYSPGASTLYDGIITVAGGDYITFNGIDLQENSSNTTGTTRMEWGYGLVKKSNSSPFDGCQYVVIKNCTITLSNADTLSAGIYVADQTSSDTTSLVITASSDAMNNCTFAGNTIQNAFNGIVLKGYYGDTTTVLYDQNNTITNNIIQNYGLSPIYRPAYGIYLAYENAALISGNSINNAAGGGSPHGNALYGIYVNSLNRPLNGTLTIRSNTFTLNRGSNALISYGVYNNIFNCDVVVSNNTFQNWVVGGGSGAVYCYYQGAQNNSISLDSNHIINNTSLNTTGAIYGFYCNSKTQIVNIRKDTIQNLIRSTAITGFMYAMNLGGSAQGGSAVISDNYIYNLNNNSNNSSNLYGIIQSANNLQSLTLSGNTIDSLVVGAATTYGINFQFNNPANVYSNTVSRIYSSSTIYGIYGTSLGAASANNSIYSNNINALSSSGNTAAVYGIYISPSGSGGQSNIYKNKIYNILESGAGTTPKVYGIYVTASGVVNLSCYVYNNFISDIRVPNSLGAANNIYGLYLSGSAATHYLGAYYNTIYLNAVCSGAAFATAGIYASTTPVVDLRNNIVVNTSYSSNGSPTGYHAVYQRSSTTLTNYSSVSNNNDFYKGSTAQNVTYYDGTTAYPTLAAYQTLVSPREGLTFSENPPFINLSTTPNNLHINPNVPTQVESGGTPVTSPLAVNDDFDGDTRNASTPDVGADEYAPVKLPLNITALIEGFYNGTSMVSDTVTAELHSATSPYALVSSIKGVLNTSGLGNFNFWGGISGTSYYIAVKHRNTVEIWSAAPTSSATYNFTSAQTQAYGSNMIQKGSKWCIYSGDVNQDGIVDSGDLGIVDNDNANYVSGYTTTDVNGDGIVDSGDLGLVDNNNANYVSKIVPTDAPVAARDIRQVKIRNNNIK